MSNKRQLPPRPGSESPAQTSTEAPKKRQRKQADASDIAAKVINSLPQRLLLHILTDGINLDSATLLAKHITTGEPVVITLKVEPAQAGEGNQ